MVNKKTSKSKAKKVVDEHMDVDPEDQTSKTTKGGKGKEKASETTEKQVSISLS
jgi:hypothetical protein